MAAGDVLALERETRLPAIAEHLAALPGLVAVGIPVVLTGDFNTPSHLDWTGPVVASRQFPYPVAWPVGAALAEAGFRDSYREAHPDPVARPGMTWTPGYPSPIVGSDEVFDRIDWVLVAGEAVTLDSRVVGEAGGPDVAVAIAPRPSDHRGVVSTFRLQPGEPPPLVAVARRTITAGEELIVRYHAPGDEGERIAILPAAGDVGSDVFALLPPLESAIDGSVVFGTDRFPAGAYEAALVGSDGSALARIPFTVLPPGARPTVTAGQPAYAVGEPIAVTWAHGPGYRRDWLGVYRQDDPNLGNYLGFLYADAESGGTVIFDEAALGGPLPPGDYLVRLMRDDGYVELATAAFSVAAAGTPASASPAAATADSQEARAPAAI